MIVLSILIFILKAIGIILAAIILLLIFLLFSTIHYSAAGSYDEKPDVRAKLRWLLHMLRVDFQFYEGESILTVKFLWFDLMGKRKKASKDKKENPEEENLLEQEREPDANDSGVQVQNSRSAKRKNRSKIAEKDKKMPIWSRITSAIDKFGKFRETYSLGDLKEHAFKLVSRLFKGLGFRKFKLDCEFGLSDPFVTGKVLGYVWIVKGMTGVKANVTGNFEREIFRLDAGFKGRTSIWRLLYPFIIFITRKPVWKLFRDSRNKKHKN